MAGRVHGTRGQVEKMMWSVVEADIKDKKGIVYRVMPTDDESVRKELRRLLK